MLDGLKDWELKRARNGNPERVSNTVIVVAITSTLKFGELPGNVVLRKGEANLPKKSVINVTQLKTVDKFSLTEKIGSLTKKDGSSLRRDETDYGMTNLNQNRH